MDFLKKRILQRSLTSLPSSNVARVLLIADRPNWAYDSIAKALVKYNKNPNLEFNIGYIKNADRQLRSIYRDYDLVFVMGWQNMFERSRNGFKLNMRFLEPSRTITGIHSAHAWDGRQSTPDISVMPPASLVDELSRFAGVNIISRRLYELFLASGLRNAVCTLNGVDTEIFTNVVKPRTDGPLRVGFSGNKGKHDWRKGVTEFIEPACDMDGVQLIMATPAEGEHVPLEQMPQFYEGVDIYLCASSSEGFSLSVLEASASGCPVITTRVGGCEDLIIDSVNGFFVERNVKDMQEKIRFFLANRYKTLEMGQMNRTIVQQKWSWEIRARAWLAFIEGRLKI